jgi:hypothetical protein
MLADVDDIKFTIERLLPPEIVEAMHYADVVLTLSPSKDPNTLVTISDELAEREQLEHMVTYRKNITGVNNTVFISPGLAVRHAPRIKVAVDPPDSINALSKQASIELSTGKVVAGEPPSAEVLKQIQKFIELNRDTLLDYWNSRITTDQLQAQLKAVPEE